MRNLSELKPCPYCKQTGFETVYNNNTEENENITCTGCWGNLEVNLQVYNNYFIETGKPVPEEFMNHLFGKDVMKKVLADKQPSKIKDTLKPLFGKKEIE